MVTNWRFQTVSNAEELAKSNQEQAVAAWINYLNQVRLDRLVASLAQQDVNLGDALASVQGALTQIGREVIDVNRGGQKGMHGFIAEVAEVGIGNAREQILGKAAPYQWVNNNSPVDLLRDGVAIQQKFVAAGGRFGLGAISEHLEKYPDFIKAGGKYQIPSDHYDIIKQLHNMSAEDATKLLSRGGNGPSYRDWVRVQAFTKKGAVPFDSLEPSKLEYAQVKRGTYKATLASEEHSLRETDLSRREEAYQESRPSLHQGARATVGAAVVEGGTTFVLAIVAKRRDGKKLKDFSSEDWQAIAGETGFSTAKGGLRGFSIYTLTNFTATPAAVASSIVTAAFGIAEQANRLRHGEISEQEFLENAELVSLEAAVSALSSFLGQAFIPVPVLGAVIGNTVGAIMYRSVSSSLSKREAALIEQYLEDQHLLDQELAGQYKNLMDELTASMTTYVEILDRAFSPNVEAALDGSIELALALNVPVDEILDTADKAYAYFTD